MIIINIILTGLLVLCVVYRQKQYGAARACVAGTGFFAAAFYLDSIFRLIMGNAVSLAGNFSPGAVSPAKESLVLGGMTQLMGIFLSKSILGTVLIAANTAGSGAGRPKAEAPYNGWQYLDGLTVCITVFFLILGFACLKSGGEGDFSVALRLFFLFMLLLAYYISLLSHRKRQYAQRRLEEVETRERQEKLYLKNVEEQYQRTRELWHDLKNHISLLSLLLQEEKYERMADYLRIFGDDVDSLTLPVKSGNPVVDALLADKVARAKKEDIQVELSLCDLTGLSLKPDEICSLLGNLLDNALEANRQVAEGRFLSVECRKGTKGYYIKVQNAAANSGNAGLGTTRGQKANMLQSRKSDRRNQVGHGLGIRSMERIVHANGGELAVERTESRFTAVVRLPEG